MSAQTHRDTRQPCDCQCGEGKSEAFDAKAAFDRLAKKQDELAQLLAAYMATAPAPAQAQSFGVQANAPANMSDAIARIVGGFPVAVGTFPECCLVGRKSTNGTFRWFCTGVLVHPRIVLTAGHCFNAQQPANVVALRAENQNVLDNAEVLQVRRMVQHSGFPSSGRHDISVMVLRKAATVAPVRIATAQEIQQARNTTLVGFGNDDVLSTRGFGIKREVNVPITSIPQTGGPSIDDLETEFGFESDLEFVAGGGGFDSCNGDSGGPAYITVGGTRVVGGLTSRATENAQNPCGGGGVYTRVDVHADFIRQVAAGSGITL